MKTYKIHDAKTNLSRILREVTEGETVYIARSNKIIAELKPVEKTPKPFPFGTWKNKYELNDNWKMKKSKRDIEDLFYDSKDFEA